MCEQNDAEELRTDEVKRQVQAKATVRSTQPRNRTDEFRDRGVTQAATESFIGYSVCL